MYVFIAFPEDQASYSMQRFYVPGVLGVLTHAYRFFIYWYKGSRGQATAEGHNGPEEDASDLVWQ